MNASLIPRFAAVLLLGLSTAHAQTTPDERAVWASVETTWNHFAYGDLDDALADYEHWHRWGVDTPGLWSRADLREHEERNGQSGRIDDLRLEPVLIQVFGDAAVVHYIAHVTYVFNESEDRFPTASRWSDFRVRQGDRWLIVGGFREGMCQLVGEGERLPEEGNACHEPYRDVSDGSWPHETLTAAERARYVGSYAETLAPGMEPAPVQIWEADGVLHITAFPNDRWDEIHLVPMGDHTFAMGRFADGRLVEVYYPDTRGRFLESDGRLVGYEFITDGRVRSSGARTD
jgi:hypothetical protein